MAREYKIVTIGGGSGLSTILRGLKLYTSDITAIVTVADDGGGSGVLRQELGMLPPGDIRNCILALANTEPIMTRLLNFRFQDGMLKGQSFGNLFLAAMDGICGSFEEAVRRMSDVLAVTGKVLPVTLDDIKLCALMDNGDRVVGESIIPHYAVEHHCRIAQLYLEPQKAQPTGDAIRAITEADVILLGPGSLYTSVIPNLLVNGIVDTLKVSTAMKIYICNVMTQPGETTGFTVTDHLRTLESVAKCRLIDYCVVNQKKVDSKIVDKYLADGADYVFLGKDEAACFEDVQFIESDILNVQNDLVRHDADVLCELLFNLITQNISLKN